MTNETTASQPKSIGDDAQFLKLIADLKSAEGRDAEWIAVKEVTQYLDSKLRAPAAQASATIQAAPVGWEPVYMTWNDTIMAWVDVGLAEYEAAEPEERRTTYQPAEVN